MADEVEVVVTIPESEPEQESSPEVVVIETAPVDNYELEDLRAYKTQREEQDRIENEERLAAAESAAQLALDIAVTDATSEVEPEPEPEPEIIEVQAEPEVDSEPQREHWFWRGWK